MVSVAIFCMPKHPEKLSVAMHPEKLPVAGSVGGRFFVYRNGVLIWIITNLIMKN